MRHTNGNYEAFAKSRKPDGIEEKALISSVLGWQV